MIFMEHAVANSRIEDTSAQDVYVGKPSQRKRFVVGSVGACILLIGSWFAFDQLGDLVAADDFYERAKLRSAVVTRGQYERNISVEGRVVSTFSPTLYAQDTGEVSLFVMEGQTVKAGQLLARIDNPELASRMDREQAALKLQEVELDTLRNKLKQQQLQDEQSLTLLQINLEAEKREMNRLGKVLSQGPISVNEYEKTKDRVHALEVQVANGAQQNELSAQNHVFELRTKALSIEQQRLLAADISRQVQALTLISPVDGIVGDVRINEKDTVAKKEPIMAVVDLSSYEVEVLVPETYADSLRLGMAASVTFGGNELDATLSSISPEVNSGSVAARLEFTGLPPAGLRQNLRLNCRVVLESREDVLKVKRGPFVESHGGRGAYVVKGDLAEFHRIHVGSVGIHEVEIVSGLQAGDEVIISNTAELMGAQTVLITD